MSEMYDEYLKVFAQIDKVFFNSKFPKLKNAMKNSITYINNISDLLIRKSLLKEDRYNYDEASPDNFYLPEEKVFPGEQKATELHKRLKYLTHALSYLSEHIPFSIEEVSEDNYLENCRKVLDYFSFHKMASASLGINSRTLKETFDKASRIEEENFKKLLSDNLKLLVESYTLINQYTGELTKIEKELYKTKVRFEILDGLALPQFSSETFFSNKNKYINELSRYIIEKEIPIKINPFWLLEVVNEYYSIDEIEILKRITNTYLTPAEIKKYQVKISPREELTQVIFEIAAMSSLLNDLYHDFNYNYKILREDKKSLLNKLKKMLSAILRIEDTTQIINIQYVNPFSKQTETESVNLTAYGESLKKKVDKYIEIRTPNSSINNKIKNQEPLESMEKFANTLYYDLKLTNVKIAAIDSEMRMNTNSKKRSEMKNLMGTIQRLEIAIGNIAFNFNTFKNEK